MDNIRRLMNLQLFADDGGGSGGGDPGGGGTPNHGDGGGGGTGGPKTYTEDYVRALRGEAAGYRTQLRELEGILGTVKQHFGVEGEVSDWSKVLEGAKTAQQQAIEQATSKAQTLLIKAEIKAQAADLGIVDAEAAERLADLSGVQIGDDGAVTGVKEALTALVEAKPYLKGAPGKVGGPSNPGAGNAPKDLDSQIAEAESKGDWKLARRLKLQKLAELQTQR